MLSSEVISRPKGTRLLSRVYNHNAISTPGNIHIGAVPKLSILPQAANFCIFILPLSRRYLRWSLFLSKIEINGKKLGSGSLCLTRCTRMRTAHRYYRSIGNQRPGRALLRQGQWERLRLGLCLRLVPAGGYARWGRERGIPGWSDQGDSLPTGCSRHPDFPCSVAYHSPTASSSLNPASGGGSLPWGLAQVWPW